jgi:hypothetical protein
MLRSSTSLVVALAVLTPGLAWPSPSAPVAGAGAHACCLRAQAKGCATTAITCCPAPEREHRGTTPPGSAVRTPAPAQALHGAFADDGSQASLARALSFGTHAEARANAPPGPLYLKHLTLLV